jgi:hypothetical protein
MRLNIGEVDIPENEWDINLQKLHGKGLEPGKHYKGLGTYTGSGCVLKAYPNEPPSGCLIYRFTTRNEETLELNAKHVLQRLGKIQT